jgi:hypothetical protein
MHAVTSDRQAWSMSHDTVIAMLVTCASGYTMLFGGLAKRTLRLGVRGRCRHCGRLRAVCTCRRSPL